MRQVIGSFEAPEGESRRAGAYWGIRTDIKVFALPNHLPCPVAQTTALAETPTRLQKMDKVLQERVVNWGYAICDAAMRRHMDRGLPAATAFPYASSGVG